MGALARAVVKAKQLLLAFRRGAMITRMRCASSSMPETKASRSAPMAPMRSRHRECLAAMPQRDE